MKKIIFIVVIFFGIEKSCLAISKNEISKIKNMYYICDEENMYQTYHIEYNLRYAFFLNLSGNYNFNFEDYYPISFEDSPFPSEIQYFSGTDIMEYDPFYISVLQRILWEKLYPDKEFVFCHYNKENYYNEVRNKIHSIYNGPDFINETVYQDENIEYEYDFPYLGYFKIASAQGVSAEIKGSKLKVSGKKGRYQVILKRNVKIDGFTENLFTDGTNYLLTYPKVTEQEYILNVVIGINDVTLNIKDENNNLLENICFMIDDEKYCSNNKGIINYETSNNNYNLKLINNEKYNDLNLKLSVQKKQDIILFKKEEKTYLKDNEKNKEIIEVKPENNQTQKEEQIIIEVKDTFTVAKVFILGVVILIVLYAIIKAL